MQKRFVSFALIIIISLFSVSCNKPAIKTPEVKKQSIETVRKYLELIAKSYNYAMPLIVKSLSPNSRTKLCLSLPAVVDAWNLAVDAFAAYVKTLGVNNDANKIIIPLNDFIKVCDSVMELVGKGEYSGYIVAAVSAGKVVIETFTDKVVFDNDIKGDVNFSELKLTYEECESPAKLSRDKKPSVVVVALPVPGDLKELYEELSKDGKSKDISDLNEVINSKGM